MPGQPGDVGRSLGEVLREPGNGLHALWLGGPRAADNPVESASGDLNQDGGAIDDIAIAFAGTPFAPGTSGIGVIFDALAGALVPLPVPAGRTSQDVAIGDLNADGINDVAAVEEAGTAAPIDRLLIFENSPAGTLTPVAAHLNTTGEPKALCIADLDGNGRADDIAVGTDNGFAGTGELEIFTNLGFGALGAGRFNAAAVFTTPIGVNAIACGDLQSDTIKRFAPGQPAFFKAQDVVVANATGMNDLTVFNGFDSNNNLMFDSSSTLCDFDQLPSDVEMADLTNDGLPDLAVTDQAINSSQVCVVRSRVRARSTPFGVGCAGTNGVPVLTGNNLAVMGQTATIDIVNARGSASVTTGISVDIIENPIGGAARFTSRTRSSPTRVREAASPLRRERTPTSCRSRRRRASSRVRPSSSSRPSQIRSGHS